MEKWETEDLSHYFVVWILIKIEEQRTFDFFKVTNDP